MLTKAYIPYKGYYSSPFARWQGSMQHDNAIVLGAETSKRYCESRNWDPKEFDYVILGMSVSQQKYFYAGPWAAAMMGAVNSPGILISQACATSSTGVYMAANGIETGMYKRAYTLFTDRCSNGPHTTWPEPLGMGGKAISEDWVQDHFTLDPWGGQSMVQTAENVAKEAGITREECDAVAVRRYEQYLDALADDRAFQKEYMFPVECKVTKKKSVILEADEGVMETTKEGLARLTPPNGGVITFGAQTHPADGHSALIVTTRETAKEMSVDPSIEIQVLSFGFSRVGKAQMAKAPVPAANKALEAAGLKVTDIDVIKTHNPFAVNDIYMAKEMGIDVNGFNNYGSSLVFGHPQAPTAGRLIVEGIEEAVKKGGGYMMFTGCAAGDLGAAVICKVGK